MKNIEEMAIVINDDASLEDYTKGMKINPNCKISKEAEIAFRNGVKINFMLDNVTIDGDEDNRALMILLRPLRLFKMPAIEYDSVKGIYAICMIILGDMIRDMSFDELLKLSNPLPPYQKEEIELAREIYNKMKNELS